MRHRKLKYKLGTDPAHRKAILRNLARSLVEHERIVTTETRAKALRRIAERLVTWAKQGDLHARRQVLKVIPQKKLVAKLFDKIAPRFTSRNGGYTRILKLGFRRGDAASLVLMEWVGYEDRFAVAEEKEPKKKKTKKPETETKAKTEAKTKTKGKSAPKKAVEETDDKPSPPPE